MPGRYLREVAPRPCGGDVLQYVLVGRIAPPTDIGGTIALSDRGDEHFERHVWRSGCCCQLIAGGQVSEGLPVLAMVVCLLIGVLLRCELVGLIGARVYFGIVLLLLR